MAKENREALLTGNLTLLMALEANGLDKPAGALVDKIGVGLSRRPATAGPPASRDIELPDQERGRSEFDIKDLDRINARLTANAYRASGGVTAAEKREADLVRRDELERRPQARADQQWQRESQAETEALAAGRGEQVAADKAGVKRILDRDPLLSLARAQHLTPDQLETGLEVRLLYERRAEDAGATEYTGMPGGGMRDHVGAGLARAKACEKIGRIERAIAVHCSTEPAVLVMIRVVCERGMAVTSQGKGRAFERNCRALAQALDVADDVIKRRL